MIYFNDVAGNIIYSGHCGSRFPKEAMHEIYTAQADGHELLQALDVLGRNSCNNRVHTFVGDAAKEIFRNWL